MGPKSTTGERARRARRKVVSSLTLEQAATSWYRAQEARGRSRHTLIARRQALGLLLRWLREQDASDHIAEITRRHLEDFLIDLRRTYAPSSCLTHYGALKVFFNWCVNEEEIDYSPMARIQKPPIVEHPPQILTREKVSALLKSCAGKTFEDRRDRAIFMLLIDTGMRLHEIAQLTLETVNMTTGTLTIVGKGRKPRAPHFDVTAAAALDAYLRARSRYLSAHPQRAASQALWLGKRGALTNTGIYQMVRRRAQQAGISGVHPHLFRHGFADAWLDADGQEGALAILAGWTPGSKMLARYGAARAEKRAQEAHKRLSPANRLNEKK